MIYSFDDYELDLAQVELRHRGQALSLEPQVFALLCLLVENRERMVSKDEIIEKIWDGRVVSESALTSRVKSARRAVGDDGETQHSIRTVRGRGFRFVAEVSALTAQSNTAVMTGGGTQRKIDTLAEARPSLAVLPFQWLGSSESHRIVADALPHELITALSRLHWLAIIARGSSFRFRAPDTDVREIGHTLNASYCVCGLIEGRGNTLDVVADLIDTRDSRVLWGERFSIEVDAIHDVRAQIVANIVAALEVYIPMHEAQLAHLKPPDSLDAWASYHLGLQAMYRFNQHDNAAAERHFRNAVKLEPEFARAHAGLSFTNFQDAFLKYGNDPRAAADQARRNAERSVELDPYDPFANFVMGRSFWLAGDIESSLSWLERSVSFSPSFAQGIYARGWADAVAGRGLDSQAHVDEAMRLSPLDPLLYAMMGTRALSHIAQDQLDAAPQWAEKAASAPGAHVFIAMIAVAAQGLAGNGNRAAFWAGNAKRRRPDVTRQHFFQSFPFGNPDMRRKIDAVLKKHGL